MTLLRAAILRADGARMKCGRRTPVRGSSEALDDVIDILADFVEEE